MIADRWVALHWLHCAGCSEVSSEGISIPPENIEAVSKRPYPKDVTSLQSLLGYMNYYRAYIPQFAELAAPLYTLTKIDPKKIPYIWKPAHQEAFDALITAMTHAPMLCIPTFWSIHS